MRSSVAVAAVLLFFGTFRAMAAPVLTVDSPANQSTITDITKLYIQGKCSEVGKDILIEGAIVSKTKCYSSKTFGIVLNMRYATLGNYNTYALTFISTGASGTTKVYRTYIAPPAPPATFSFIPPTSAASLKTLAATQEGVNVISYARGALNTTPAPSAHFQAAGLLPTDPDYNALVKAKNQWVLMLYMAQAYRMTDATNANHAKFLTKLEEYFTAWLNTYKLDFNPQSYTNTDPEFILSEDPRSIHYLFHPIVQTDMDVFLMAYDYVKADLSAAVRDKMTKFQRNLVNGYLLEIDMLKRYEVVGKYQPPNYSMNWHAHRLKILFLAAYGLGDEGALAKARAHAADFIELNILGRYGFNETRIVTPLLKTYYDRQIGFGIVPEGSMIDFYVRDAIHYTQYTIDPLLMIALMTKNHKDGMEIFANTKSSLLQALRWVVPYAQGLKKHNEFVYSMVEFDAQRAKAGMKGYSGPWDRRESLDLFLMAGKVYSEFRPLAATLDAIKAPPLNAAGFPNWGTKSMTLILHGM